MIKTVMTNRNGRKFNCYLVTSLRWFGFKQWGICLMQNYPQQVPAEGQAAEEATHESV